jgi:hypothetical protein
MSCHHFQMWSRDPTDKKPLVPTFPATYFADARRCVCHSFCSFLSEARLTIYFGRNGIRRYSPCWLRDLGADAAVIAIVLLQCAAPSSLGVTWREGELSSPPLPVAGTPRPLQVRRCLSLLSSLARLQCMPASSSCS